MRCAFRAVTIAARSFTHYSRAIAQLTSVRSVGKYGEYIITINGTTSSLAYTTDSGADFIVPTATALKPGATVDYFSNSLTVTSGPFKSVISSVQFFVRPGALSLTNSALRVRLGTAIDSA
jgi:hypothetical protein